MEVNILPGAGVGHVVLLVGGGARVTIPPGNGFTIIVNPVAGGAMGAAGGAMGAAGGAMGAAVANENIAAITGVFFFFFQLLNQPCLFTKLLFGITSRVSYCYICSGYRATFS